MVWNPLKSRAARGTGVLLLSLSLLAPAAAVGGEGHAHGEEAHEPTVAEQVAGLEAMCAANADAIAARQAEKSLYERLGGEEKIREFVTETVRLHDENAQIEHAMEGVDREHLIDMVTAFLVAATGGEGKYEGRGMVESHEHLKLTNADFLAAGGDVMTAMKASGCGEEEIQEVICAFVGLRKAVVVESERELQ